ncbi:hypothetical protein [Methanobacterium sp.]|uniref:hypothetical protein n=1 Tax=Methanobacterium sp. TaxID=2164 RepID=UPI003C70AA20
MTGKNTNYLLTVMVFIVALYAFYTKYYFNASGWFLLGLTLILISYLSKINADKKYYIMALPLPILSLICFALEFFY